MTLPPAEITLDLRPAERFELIDVTSKLEEEHGDFFGSYRRVALCSFHTTAGYLEQRFCARLGHSDRRLGRFVDLFRQLFPPGAGYFHDRMELREELSDSQREREPVNADSHLAFMSAGLRNFVTYAADAAAPIYFIDLDGVNGEGRRRRRTAVVGYQREEPVRRETLAVPVSNDHPVDSFNLKGSEFGLFERLGEMLERHGVEQGRVDIRLGQRERHSGLTVNEYETLLMRNDLPAALRNPLRYAVRHGKELLRHPGSIPEKTRDYAVYDLVHLYNELMDAVGVGREVADRILSRLSAPAFRFFRLKRRVSFMVSASEETGGERIVHGTYQSPILIQHQPAPGGARELEIELWRFQ